jgi:hypothetical protein
MKVTTHQHSFVQQILHKRAPCADGGHTTFYLLICRCGHAEVFPSLNFTLTTPEFQTEVRQYLALHDCVLDEGPVQ